MECNDRHRPMGEPSGESHGDINRAKFEPASGGVQIVSVPILNTNSVGSDSRSWRLFVGVPVTTLYDGASAADFARLQNSIEGDSPGFEHLR